MRAGLIPTDSVPLSSTDAGDGAPDTAADTAPDTEAAVHAVARRARTAAAELAQATRATKDAALAAMAQALRAASAQVLAANSLDVHAARDRQTAQPLLDRLMLTPARIEAMAVGLDTVAALPDPVGEVVRGYTRPNGLQVSQLRVPFGVVAMIYEARPNVTVDAAGLLLKSGNAALLRGSASAANSNRVLVQILSQAASSAGLPADSVQLVPGADHAAVLPLLTARGLIDVVIPRGGAGLIRYVIDNASVPVIETGTGNVHIYVDAAADLAMAEQIVLNAKTSRPSVCNAAESLLVHADVAAAFLPGMLDRLAAAGVTVHGDEQAQQADSRVLAATDEDWATEYLSLDIAVRTVTDLAEAVGHIRRWSSGHTEVIVTGDLRAARQFVAQVDSAAVLVNASSRFTDGEEFGFGAEIGISTQKLHARGPMGLTELTSTKWVVFGDGQLR